GETDTSPPPPLVLVERNYFRDQHGRLVISRPHKKVTVRHNVLDGPLSIMFISSSYPPPDLIEIYNNTEPNAGACQFTSHVPAANVTIRNNILREAFQVADGKGVDLDVTKTWHVANNSYVYDPERNKGKLPLIFRRPGDLSEPPTFLSED